MQPSNEAAIQSDYQTTIGSRSHTGNTALTSAHGDRCRFVLERRSRCNRKRRFPTVSSASPCNTVLFCRESPNRRRNFQVASSRSWPIKKYFSSHPPRNVLVINDFFQTSAILGGLRFIGTVSCQ